MLGAVNLANAAHTPVRPFGRPDFLQAIRRPDTPTPRVELPAAFPTSTNPMPHAHREVVLASALASQGPVLARALLDKERRDRVEFFVI